MLTSNPLLLLHLKYFFYHFQEYCPFSSRYFYPQPCDLTHMIRYDHNSLLLQSFDQFALGFVLFFVLILFCFCFIWFGLVFLKESHTLSLNFVCYFQHYLSSVTCISKNLFLRVQLNPRGLVQD